MSSKTTLTPVKCKLKDCVFYREHPEKGEVFCAHPEINFHKNNFRCPLYQLDWTKKMQDAEVLTRRMKK